MLFCNIDLLDENFECEVGVKDGKIDHRRCRAAGGLRRALRGNTVC